MDSETHFTPMPEEPEFRPFEEVPPAPVSRASRGFAIASLVLGIASLCTCCCCCCGLVFLPFLCGVLAVVFAVLAKTRAADKKMPGMAIAGMILGIIAIVISIIFFALLLAVPPMDSEFWVEYEEILRAELGDEMFEEYFGDVFPAEPLE